MPILSMQARNVALPVIGNIRKGEPRPEDGKRPGKDLDYFRFEPTDPSSPLRQHWLSSFDTAGDGKVRSFSAFLPYKRIDENLRAWMMLFSAAGLQRRCSGPHGGCIHRELVGSGYVDYAPGEKPCVCEGLLAQGKQMQCKQSAQLHCIIPQLGAAGVCVLHTSSINDIVSLDAQLRAINELVSDPGIEDLSGIPVLISRIQRFVSQPTPDGAGRRRMLRWMLSIQIDPTWMQNAVTRASFAIAGRILRPQIAMMGGERPALVDKLSGEVLATVERAGFDEVSSETGYVIEDGEEEGEYIEALSEKQALDIAELAAVMWGEKADKTLGTWVNKLTAQRTKNALELSTEEAEKLLSAMRETQAKTKTDAG